MTLQQACEILKTCHLDMLKDPAFGDSEVEWFRDNKSIASGYFGHSTQQIRMYDGAQFKGQEAYILRDCYATKHIARN